MRLLATARCGKDGECCPAIVQDGDDALIVGNLVTDQEVVTKAAKAGAPAGDGELVFRVPMTLLQKAMGQDA